MLKLTRSVQRVGIFRVLLRDLHERTGEAAQVLTVRFGSVGSGTRLSEQIVNKEEREMAITLVIENMLRTFEESESNQEGGNDDHDFEKVLKRFENAAGQIHSEIRYSEYIKKKSRGSQATLAISFRFNT